MISRKPGFTLIELMVVVIIIAALAAMVLPKVLPASDAAKRDIARGDMAGIKTALKLYRLYNDRYPTTEEGLRVLLKPSTSTSWKEAYLDSEPVDPWQRDYKYEHPGSRSGSEFDIWSLGPDGQDGTGDDVTGWGN
ncbi:MAG: type II secretion system major pseudopilin GspG [Lentisphaerae bacterium]|nr:type II secretion system major pseudopilin GspG [Lentisphaerota bacterium]